MSQYSDNLYVAKEFEVTEYVEQKRGIITEHDKLIAGKQILLGLAILFIITECLYIFSPAHGKPLLEICKTVLPPLATLIIAFYFKDKSR